MTPPRPSRPTRLRLPCLGLATLLLLGGGAAAEPSMDAYEGSWAYVGGRSEKRAIRAAIENSVSSMTLVLRGLARKRLQKGSKVPRTLTIEADATQIAIRHDQRSRLASPPGQVTRSVSSTGDEIELLYELQSGALVQYRTTPQGGRRTIYRLDDGGRRLVVEVVTSSHYLPSPITYRLSYERAGPTASPP